MPRNIQYLQAWCERNRLPFSVATELDDPLVFLREDIERATLDLTATVEDACGSLEVPERRRPSTETLRDMHDAVRAGIDDAFEEFHWQARQAWRRFKEAIARDAAGGR